MNFHELANALETIARSRGVLSREEYARMLQDIGKRLLKESRNMLESCGPPTLSRGGMGEEVRIQIFGPDHTLKQDIFRR